MAIINAGNVPRGIGLAEAAYATMRCWRISSRFTPRSRANTAGPRMWKELLARSVCVGEERVRKLIAQHGIRARHKRKYIASTNSNHGLPFAPNLLKRNFNFSRAVSVENIQLMRAPLAFRSCSQAATSVNSRPRLSMRRSRHWLRSTPISISTMLSQLACLGV